MADKILDRDEIAFQAEGRLLQELGLRLVASPEVALVELIKNAYDADSSSCEVRVGDDGKSVVVADTGNGMTLDDFKTRWMRIATSRKIEEGLSPTYRRKMTGAKGIGRFAVRYLGDEVTLDSVAFDGVRKQKTRLRATFDWALIDGAESIMDVKIPYELSAVPEGTFTGTQLQIRKLRQPIDFTNSEQLRSAVLRIVSPLAGLDRGRFKSYYSTTKKDPGFEIRLPGQSETPGTEVELAGFVLDNYWARLTIEMTKRNITFEVTFPGKKAPKRLELTVDNTISKGFFADIRFFPRRKGVFQAKGIKGPDAWAWVRENRGVAVVDHGFRIKPFGFFDDDWLSLDQDKAHNERDWRTEIARVRFGIPDSIKPVPGENPMLNLPSNYQLVGAVFVESEPDTDSNSKDLIPSMDREGFLENEAFEELKNFVRAGIEFLAHQDKLELNRREEALAKEAVKSAKEEVRQAIEHIEQSPTLTRGDKNRIVRQYVGIAERLEEQEEYSANARRSLLMMSLLGVVAGFMTHESKALMHELEEALSLINSLAKKHPDLRNASEKLTDQFAKIKGYLEYSQRFVRNVRSEKEAPLSAGGQTRLILKRFRTFAEDHGIKVVNAAPDEVMTPPLPVNVYSGILLNLYTNALKAVISVKGSIQQPTIAFRSWNEKGHHVIEVADNGVGIPPQLRKRIWDPLYTTTSDVGNPLGSGMGLGLPLVKQVVSEFGGTIELIESPPAGFTTCFRVMFDLK